MSTDAWQNLHLSQVSSHSRASGHVVTDHRIKIRHLALADQSQSVQLKAEYLDDQPFEEFTAFYQRYPELFVGLFNDNRLIGICFGWPLSEQFPEEKEQIALQGIAVNSEFAAQGLGSKLLNFWEDQVANRGDRFISVGSAPGYVERFYLKHGYQPIQYLVYGREDSLAAALTDKGFEVVRTRRVGDSILVNIKTGRYDPDFRDALCRDFPIDEAIYIFQKEI